MTTRTAAGEFMDSGVGIMSSKIQDFIWGYFNKYEGRFK